MFVSISGTTGVEIASGLHWYLKYWCGAHVSWDKTGGIQTTSIPKTGSLPLIKDGGVKIKRPVPWNYYQNVVTSSCEYQNQLSNLFCSICEKLCNITFFLILCRFICLVGLGKVGKGGRLDGTSGGEPPLSIHRPGGYLAKGF